MGDGHHLRRSDRDANLLFGHSGSYNNALHETATYPIDGHRSCIWFSARNPGPDGYATCPASSLSTDCPSYFLCMGSLWHDGNMLHESAVLRVTPRRRGRSLLGSEVVTPLTLSRKQHGFLGRSNRHEVHPPTYRVALSLA